MCPVESEGFSIARLREAVGPARMGTHPSAAIDHVSLFFFLPSFVSLSLSLVFEVI